MIHKKSVAHLALLVAPYFSKILLAVASEKQSYGGHQCINNHNMYVAIILSFVLLENKMLHMSHLRINDTPPQTVGSESFEMR